MSDEGGRAEWKTNTTWAVPKHLPEQRGSGGRSPGQPGGAAGVGRHTRGTIPVTHDDNQQGKAQEACAWLRNISITFHHLHNWRKQTAIWNTN